MRKTPPLIDTARLRQLYEPLFLSLLGGYQPGVTSERALVRERPGTVLLLMDHLSLTLLLQTPP